MIVSEINVELSIDIDVIAEGVCDTSTFDSAVDNVIDNHDFSYEFERIIDDKIDGIDYIDRYDFLSHLVNNITNDDVAYEIRQIVSGAEPTQTTTTVEVPVGLLEVTALLHKVCGYLSQQMAIINTLTGVSPWPTNTGESLHKIGSLLADLGYSESTDSV